MALGAPQQNLVTEVGQLCAQLLEMSGQIEQIDVLFNGAEANWDALITDAELATIPSFDGAGITAANVADAIFILKTARAAAYSNLPAVVIMGNLG